MTHVINGISTFAALKVGNMATHYNARLNIQGLKKNSKKTNLVSFSDYVLIKSSSIFTNKTAQKLI